MTTSKALGTLTIKGFKSIQNLERFRLNHLNVLIGANGAGKSNFVSYFRMLGEMVEGHLQTWTAKQGSADRIVSFGVKETNKIESSLSFGDNSYQFKLEPTLEGSFTFASEKLFYYSPYNQTYETNLGSGHKEAKLKAHKELDSNLGKLRAPSYCYDSISSWKVYHFHDTSDTAGVKRLCAVHDNEYLRPDASNLAAFLFRLSNESPNVYEQIRKTVRLAIPFFDNFVLRPIKLETEEEQIRLLWSQTDSDYALWPSQLSDGSIRFICLVTALLQTNAPSTIIIDEPELGLHPYAITLLGALLRSASKRMQVIVSTQSVPLVNEFSINNLIIVEREQGATVFKRYKEDEFKSWLEEYSVGELWEKNILGGRPRQ
jgi:predicted ATPase